MNPEELIDKYYAHQPKLKEILLRHSHDVAARALTIVDAHPELNANRTFVYEAAMLHDIGILYTNAPGIECFGSEHYLCHGILGAQLLRNEGLPFHARVAERHTGTGLPKLFISGTCHFLSKTFYQKLGRSKLYAMQISFIPNRVWINLKRWSKSYRLFQGLEWMK